MKIDNVHTKSTLRTMYVWWWYGPGLLCTHSVHPKVACGGRVYWYMTSCIFFSMGSHRGKKYEPISPNGFRQMKRLRDARVYVERTKVLILPAPKTGFIMSHQAFYKQLVQGNLQVGAKRFTFECSPGITFGDRKSLFDKTTPVLPKWSCSMRCGWLPPSCL